MNITNSIDMQTFSYRFNNVKSDKNTSYKDEFTNALSKQMQERISDRLNNSRRTSSIPPMLLDKLKTLSGPVFEDVTYNEEYEHLFECGEYKLFRTYLDNVEGDGGKAYYLIRLRPCSKDAKIDSDKLQDIFEKAIEIVNNVIPIYAKMNGTAILAGIDYQLPFCEATGKVDFKSFVKDLMQGLNCEISNLPIDDHIKEELQKMLKECEDILSKAIDK
ncbi:MAG TPA: hypothetical protein VEB00_01970 [Clostridia bacterium]|nr:hypothetical protein [Clostridia bacterium]